MVHRSSVRSGTRWRIYGWNSTLVLTLAGERVEAPIPSSSWSGKMKRAWLAAFAFLGLFFVGASDAIAQGNITTQRIGNTLYYSGTIDGEMVSGSTQQIGQFGYTDLQVGDKSLNATTQQVGSFRYTDWSDGLSSTSQRVGSFEYTDFSNGLSATTQEIGSFEYTDISDGTSITTQSIGGFDYSTVNSGYEYDCCNW